jgi:molecular chaperone GrpE
MTDTRQTLEEQLEQQSRPEQSRPKGPSESPDASAPGDARPAQREQQPAAPETEPDQAGGHPQADQAAGQQGTDADEDALRGDVDELVAVAAQRDEYFALAQRTQADFENYRKRVTRDSAAAHERGLVKLAKELLPALDDLDRALEEADRDAERERGEDPLLQGVRLVRTELHAALARVGIESFSPKGEPFDPVEHEAMAQQPVPGAQSGSVVEVFQPGYRLGTSIIRPARVLVAA